MATKFILKKSSVASSAPVAGDLEPGEIAINLADKKLYSKTVGGTIIELADGNKLAGIEVGADVTDAANVEPLVDSHLNTGTATSGQVLSWDGSDYDWVDAGSGGGITTGKAIAMAMLFG